MFCENCDGVLVPKGGALVCLDCGNTNEDKAELEKYIIRDEAEKDTQYRIEVLEISPEASGITKDVRDELREQYREGSGNGGE